MDTSAFRVTLEMPRSISVPPSPCDIPPPGHPSKSLSPHRPHTPADRVTVRPLDDFATVDTPSLGSPRGICSRISKVGNVEQFTYSHNFKLVVVSFFSLFRPQKCWPPKALRVMGKPSFYYSSFDLEFVTGFTQSSLKFWFPGAKGVLKESIFVYVCHQRCLCGQIVASAIYTPHMRRRSQCHIHMQQQSQKPLCLLQVNILSLQFLLSIRQDSCELTNYMPHTERFTEAVKTR